MLDISFIKVLFLSRIILHKSCFDPLGSDCYNTGWSIQNRVSECGNYKFIGRFGEHTQLTQTFQLSEGRKYNFSFTLCKIDSWDIEDIFYVYYDDIILDSFAYTVHEGTLIDFYVEKSYSFQPSLGKTNITIKLKSTFDEDLENESWGMREVYLEMLDPCVDFYSECNYQGDLWRICRGNQASLSRQIPFTIKSIMILDGITVKMKDPKYFGGNTQPFTTFQPCLTDYNFPRYQKQN